MNVLLLLLSYSFAYYMENNRFLSMRSINFKGLPAYAVLYGGTCYSAINTSCQQAIFLILSTIKHVFLRIILNENKSSS